MTQFDGRIAIVTGGVQRIGLGVALSLARASATIVLVEAAADPCHTDPLVDHMVHETLSGFGKIGILVNNSGVIIVETMSDQKDTN